MARIETQSQRFLASSRRGFVLSLCVAASATFWGCSQRASVDAIPAGATVLAFGDSITHGTGAAPGEDWPRQLAAQTGWNMVNAGVPGDTAQNARARLGALLAEHQPQLVIVELGGNDFLRRRAADAVKEDLRDIVRQVHAQGSQVVLVAVPAPSLLAAVASNLSDAPLYRELAEEEGVVLVEDAIASVLSGQDLKADPIHPNAAGYRQMAGEIHRQLQQADLMGQ